MFPYGCVLYTELFDASLSGTVRTASVECVVYMCVLCTKTTIYVVFIYIVVFVQRTHTRATALLL
jgi:hypothetical protein